MSSIALYLRREASLYLIQSPVRTPPRGPFGSGLKRQSDLSMIIMMMMIVMMMMMMVIMKMMMNDDDIDDDEDDDGDGEDDDE